MVTLMAVVVSTVAKGAVPHVVGRVLVVSSAVVRQKGVLRRVECTKVAVARGVRRKEHVYIMADVQRAVTRRAVRGAVIKLVAAMLAVLRKVVRLRLVVGLPIVPVLGKRPRRM